MPRRPRITFAGVPLHVIQRGNTRHACFFADEDYKACLHWLKKHAREHECAVYTSLATASKTREAAYRELSRYQLDPGLIDEIRTATSGTMLWVVSNFRRRYLLYQTDELQRGSLVDHEKTKAQNHWIFLIIIDLPYPCLNRGLSPITINEIINTRKRAMVSEFVVLS